MKSRFGLLIGSLALYCLFVFPIACTEESKEKTVSKEVTIPDPVENPIEKGAYLVLAGGCNDCHSPKIMTPAGPILDTTRLLSGHQAGSALAAITYDATKPGNWVLFSPDLTVAVGPWGITYSANLTPDSTTGLGTWTEENFIQSLRTGKHMGLASGRPILPPMPWQSVGKLKEEDLKLMFAYLKSIPAIKNEVPANVTPNEIQRLKK